MCAASEDHLHYRAMKLTGSEPPRRRTARQKNVLVLSTSVEPATPGPSWDEQTNRHATQVYLIVIILSTFINILLTSNPKTYLF